MTLGRRLLPILFVGWIVCFGLAAVTIATGRLDIALPLIGVTSMLAGLLLVSPSLLFLWYARRASGIPQDMRRSAMWTGASNLIVGVLLAVTASNLELGALALASAIAMALLGAAVLARVFTLGATAPAPEETRVLQHRAATIAGVATMLLLVVLAPKIVGVPMSVGPSEENMRRDLRSLVTVQDAYVVDHNRYGSLAELAAADLEYRPAFSQAEITVVADSTRFIATATSPRGRLICLVWSGTPAPPADSVHGAEDGVPACWKR